MHANLVNLCSSAVTNANFWPEDFQYHNGQAVQQIVRQGQQRLTDLALLAFYHAVHVMLHSPNSLAQV